MSRPIKFRQRAVEDVRRAARRYDHFQHGLGAVFEADLEAGLQKLEEHARLFQPYFQILHRVMLDRFPYKIFFLVEPNRIQVVRVLHEKQDHPRHLRRR